MKKALKRIFTVIICMLIVLIVLFIGYEIFCAVYNSVSAENQTKQLIREIEKSDAEILDDYTFCGNSSGIGNNVDMLSLVLVRTDCTDEMNHYIQS